jgi:flagellar hook-length control protein FliK
MTSSGQPGFGGAFGAGERDDHTSIAATSASSDATTAAALGTNGDPAATIATPGATPTPAGNGTVAGTIADQVTGNLLRLASDGSREMTMRLHPAELGDVTVRVAVSGRDVSAWFASPQPQVQSAISAALGQLQTNLGNAGYNLSGAWVGADASSAQQQGSRLPMPPPLPSSAASSPALSPAAAASGAAVSGLNIYV